MKPLLAVLILWAAGTAFLAMHAVRLHQDLAQASDANTVLLRVARRQHAIAERREWSAVLWRARYEDTFAQLAAADDELWKVKMRDARRAAFWKRYGPRVAMLEK